MLLVITVGLGVAVGLYFLAKKTGNIAAQGFGYVANTVSDIGAAINPVSADNIFNRAANSVWETVTGTPGQTIGGSIYDTFNPVQTPTDTGYFQLMRVYDPVPQQYVLNKDR